MSFVDTYARMKDANVGGTLELLRLAATGGRTAFHHVSTVSVLDRLTHADESHAAGHPARLPHGYAQSKAVAERLVEQAGARGVPVTVYRLGTISGDAQTGAWNTDAFACRMLAGSVALAIFPEELAHVPITWMPVDYAARALVRLSQRPGTTERFHLVNPATVPVGTVLGWVGDFGHPVALRPYAAWRAAMRDACARGAAHRAGGPRAIFSRDRRRAGHGRPGLRASDGGGARGHPLPRRRRGVGWAVRRVPARSRDAARGAGADMTAPAPR